MTKSMKNTLRSVAVMAVISAVAVALLALANAFFPEYKASLDSETAGMIADLVGLEVSGDEAYSGGYITMDDADAEALQKFNDENGVDGNNKVLASYFIAKGEKTGIRVVESQAQGYGGNPVIIVLTSFDKENKIISASVKQQRENPTGPNNIFNADYFAAFLEYAGGKTAVSAGDILAATGATNKASVNGLSNAVNIAAAYIAEFYGGGIPEAAPEAVTDAALIAALKSVSAGERFTFYPVPSESKNAVYGIYVSDVGEIIVAGKGSGWQGAVLGLIVTVKDGAIEAVAVAEENEALSDIPDGKPAKDFELTGANLTSILSGMTLEQIKATDNVLTGTTGATLRATGPAIKQAVENALEFYPQAAEYVGGFGEVNVWTQEN